MHWSVRLCHYDIINWSVRKSVSSSLLFLWRYLDRCGLDITVVFLNCDFINNCQTRVQNTQYIVRESHCAVIWYTLREVVMVDRDPDFTNWAKKPFILPNWKWFANSFRKEKPWKQNQAVLLYSTTLKWSKDKSSQFSRFSVQYYEKIPHSSRWYCLI